MKIAIDGPAGAGKSTIAKKIAQALQYIYIDTGAMYRALTYKVLELNVNPENEQQVFSVFKTLQLALVPADGKGLTFRVLIGCEDVTYAIRQPDVSHNVSAVAKHSSVREAMVKLQQELARSHSVVMDGRDIGSTVLPQAEVKIFLHATVEERAKRRALELERQGHEVEFSQLLADIERRDFLDSTRAISPLQKADDAFEIDTTNLTINEVVDIVLTLVSRSQPHV